VVAAIGHEAIEAPERPRQRPETRAQAPRATDDVHVLEAIEPVRQVREHHSAFEPPDRRAHERLAAEGLAVALGGHDRVLADGREFEIAREWPAAQTLVGARPVGAEHQQP
jgi:hypothetical protein